MRDDARNAAPHNFGSFQPVALPDVCSFPAAGGVTWPPVLCVLLFHACPTPFGVLAPSVGYAYGVCCDYFFPELGGFCFFLPCLRVFFVRRTRPRAMYSQVTAG